MNVLLVIAGIAGLTLLLLAIAYCWKNRPYRGDGSDEWRDEMALAPIVHEFATDVGR